MENYEEMYDKLFDSITRAMTLLQEAQKETEEMFLSMHEPAIKMVGRGQKENESFGGLKGNQEPRL